MITSDSKCLHNAGAPRIRDVFKIMAVAEQLKKDNKISRTCHYPLPLPGLIDLSILGCESVGEVSRRKKNHALCERRG